MKIVDSSVGCGRKLQHWLTAMKECSKKYSPRWEQAYSLLSFLQSGSIVAFREGPDPIFGIAVDDKDEFDSAMPTCPVSPRLTAVLKLLANKDLSFRLAVVNGQPGLLFSLTEVESRASFNPLAERPYKFYEEQLCDDEYERECQLSDEKFEREWGSPDDGVADDDESEVDRADTDGEGTP